MNSEPTGFLAKLGNDADRLKGYPKEPQFDLTARTPRWEAGFAVLPAVFLEFGVCCVFGVAAHEIPDFSKGGWFPALWCVGFLLVLHSQLLRLRLPPNLNSVTDDYRDAYAKRTAYSLILIFSIAMFAIFSGAFSWKIDLGTVATILGLAGFLDIMGRDASKFENAQRFAAAKRVEALENLDCDKREIYERESRRFGYPHVNGVAGPAIALTISVLFGVISYIGTAFFASRSDESSGPLGGGTMVLGTVATISLIFVLWSWLKPDHGIAITKFFDRLSDGAATWIRKATTKFKVFLRGLLCRHRKR